MSIRGNARDGVHVAATMSESLMSERSYTPPTVCPKLIGVIGNTGQGKTSLLRRLHKLKGPKHSRLVTNAFRSPVGMTVKQYITCGAKMRPFSERPQNDETRHLLGNGAGDARRPECINSRVNKLLNFFELRECEDFLISSQSSKMSISHGQRARAHIAFIMASLDEELDYLLLDEPLSTLDLNTAIKVGGLLCRIVHQSTNEKDFQRINTIILTVHQPPATIWNLLDHVIIMHNLTVIFAGPRGYAEYFLLAHYSQCSRQPDFQDPATRIYAVLDELDTQNPNMSWVRHHDSTVLANLRSSESESSQSKEYYSPSTWLRRQGSLILVASSSMWLASKMTTLFFAPLAFLSHGLVLGFLLRKNYESSVHYSAINDAPNYNKIDTIPPSFFEAPVFKAIERIWAVEQARLVPKDLSPFDEFVKTLSAAEISEDPDFARWPLRPVSSATSNPIEDYMQKGPKGNGRIDIFDALLFSKATLKYAHKLIWCVRDNIDLFQEEMGLPNYTPKNPEWLLPFSRDQSWRNNVYEAYAIPESLPAMLTDGSRSAEEDKVASEPKTDAPSDENQIDWDSEHWDHLTAPLISSEISTLLQMLEVGSNDWDWREFQKCKPSQGALLFYVCVIAAYPQRVQSVIRCAGLPQLPSYLAKNLPIPDPPYIAPEVQTSWASPEQSSPIQGDTENRLKGRRLFLEYDEHWKFFVGLRHLLHAVRVDWLYQLLIRLIEGVILSLMAGVCLYFLIISSGFFCMQALSQWSDLRSLGAEYRMNGIIPHAYEFILAFNIATWPQTAWLSFWLCTSFIMASNLSWSLIPWTVLTLMLYIQALVGYTSLVCELSSSLKNHARDATARTMTFILVALVELSGFFIRPSNYPSHLFWLTYFSPYKWATEAINLKSAQPDHYTSATHVPQEVVLAILGNVDRSVLLCFCSLVLLYLGSFGLATAIYTLRVWQSDRCTHRKIYIGEDSKVSAQMVVN